MPRMIQGSNWECRAEVLLEAFTLCFTLFLIKGMKIVDRTLDLFGDLEDLPGPNYL